MTSRFPILIALLLTVAIAAVGATTGTADADPPKAGPTAHGTDGMVVSVSRPASEAGVAVLRKGGNAVDAAVATAFALAVTWPEAGNLGGGGFMLVHPGGMGEPTCFDYRETAPAAATKTMFADGKVSPRIRFVGTPGTVRGLALAHRRFGKLPWKDVVAPAVTLAEDGFTMDAALASGLNGVVEHNPDNAELCRVFGKDNGKAKWKAGDKLVQPDLAKTLRRIADKGADGFYAGETADLIAAQMKAGGGLITKDDLTKYEAKERKPIHGTFRGYDVYGPPPPSSGGICLVEMLNILENFELKKQGRDSPQTLHLMIEAMRRAYCDRARHLGDPDFVKVPAELTTKEYARKLAKEIKPDKATPSRDLAKDIPIEGEGSNTTHFSVIDKDGMAVSNTYTLENGFGARVVVRGAGFLLNDEMGDFNPKPGATTAKGQIGTEPNQIAPGKRMLSSMTPVIVTFEGRPYLVLGSPGGRTIINTVLCVTLNVLEFEMPLRQAVDAPRLHHQWLPDAVSVEEGLLKQHGAALEKLRALGHTINKATAKQGDVHAIRRDAKTREYEGVADQRRSGWAAGFGSGDN
jgi:gamma-glutamyltranspeptidase/glutathione hydrolase